MPIQGIGTGALGAYIVKSLKCYVRVCSSLDSFEILCENNIGKIYQNISWYNSVINITGDLRGK